MGRLNRLASAAAFVGVAAATVLPASAQTGPARTSSPELQSASVVPSAIVGYVSDERGGPVAGALISAIGTTVATAVTDKNGRFAIRQLPPGDYVVRAHLSGFTASRRELVQVGANAARVYRLQVRRLDVSAAASRPIMTAGFGGGTVEATAASADEAAGSEHPHTETAWRLRHIKRSILKSTNESGFIAANDTPDIFTGSFFGSVAAQPGAGTSLFADLPFSGEVNLLTTGAFGPGGTFLDGGLPRGVAYLSIGAPTSAGHWSMRAAMSEGDIASWIVAGAFVSRDSKYHTYNVGLSYTSQDYQGGNPVALAAVKDGSRRVGEVYGLDRWTLSPGLTFEYGGRYARYDYLLSDQGLFSPRVGVTLEPVKGTRVTAVLARREIAPGAEEFLATGAEGPWLPPERTFAPFAGDELRVERARYLDVLVEHEFDGAYAIGVRRFFQDVDDQLVTFFGLNLPDEPRSVGHYYVASVGTVNANGWGVRLSTPGAGRVRGSIDYTLTRARWIGRPAQEVVNTWTEAARRPDQEDIHDITTAIHTDFPETATRLYVLYKLNTAYTRARDVLSPGLDGRFDIQVNQVLPFGLAGTQWELLVGLRNLFRDATDPASVYDELLVVRPPKRVVGGFLVRF